MLSLLWSGLMSSSGSPQRRAGFIQRSKTCNPGFLSAVPDQVHYSSVQHTIQHAMKHCSVFTTPGTGHCAGNGSVRLKRDDLAPVFCFVDVPAMQDDFIYPGLLCLRNSFRHLSGIPLRQHHRPAVFIHHHLMHSNPVVFSPVSKAGMKNHKIASGLFLVIR